MGADVPTSPRAAYDARLAERQAAAARFDAWDRRVAWARAATTGAAVLIGWQAWGAGRMSPWWLAAPVAVFLGLVIVHERVIRQLKRLRRAADFYTRGLARLSYEWADKGTSGDRFRQDDHLYAADLDLFGRGSLFELLCLAGTDAGEKTLAAWLTAPATPDEVRARQRAVQELAPRLDLREDLSLLGRDLRDAVHPAAISAWATAPVLLAGPVPRVAAAALVAVTIAAVGVWGAGAAGPVPAGLAGAAGLAFGGWHVRRVRRVLAHVDAAGDELTRLSQVLARLEQESFSSPRLAALRTRLDAAGLPPSRQIAALCRLISVLDARRNQLFLPLSYALLWATQCAYAIEAWRARVGPAVPAWLDAVGEIEALSSLAGYAWEHPDDVYPEVIDTGDGPLLDGRGLGHPFITPGTNVRNDVRLAGSGRGPGGPHALVVSGSNMSGKSTLLRTVGVNVVLALAGAPVRAEALTLTPLAVGASLRIQDSLLDGRSRFYAEITRLRRIVDLAPASPPLLFLLDEMLAGTNSHDRRVGAEAVLRGLVARNAIGLVTTHDLALARIADVLAPGVANVHFEDHLEDGRMIFDYRCRPGVVTRSNALALMKAVGLEV